MLCHAMLQSMCAFCSCDMSIEDKNAYQIFKGVPSLLKPLPEIKKLGGAGHKDFY